MVTDILKRLRLNVPKEYKKEFLEYVKITNTYRMFLFTAVCLFAVIIINIIRCSYLIKTGDFSGFPLVDTISKTIFFIFYLYIFGRTIYMKNTNNNYINIYIYTFILIFLIFQTIFTYEELGRYSSIYNFTAGLLLTSIGILLNVYTIFIFVIVYGMCATFLIFNANLPPEIESYNISYLIIFELCAFMSSQMFYISAGNNFTTQKALTESKAELESLVDKLEILSVTDQLTGLCNRRGFKNHATIFWNQCRRESTPLSIIIADIDKFKLYNDNYGHLAGDYCLQKVALAFNNVFQRGTDIIGRYGGEEFIVAMPFADENDALIQGQKLVNEIESFKITHDFADKFKYLTVSVGISTVVPVGSISYERLISFADSALYTAKANGGNTVVAEKFDFGDV